MSKEEIEELVERAKDLSEEEGALYLYTKLPHEELVRNTIASDARREGKAEGLAEAKIETAKNMLKMDIDIQTISKATGLTIEEIENIQI